MVVVVALGKVVYPLAALSGRRGIGQQRAELMIGAGTRGWDLIEYQEIFWSASEYFGQQAVSRVTFPEGFPVVKVLSNAIQAHRPSHYFFDPRAGSQNPIRAIGEALRIGILLSRNGITPICSLTDFPVRIWRLQCAIVSARRGVVTTLMSPKLVAHLFPHRRLIGPMPFPMSQATLSRLSTNQTKVHKKSENVAVFVGSLYEPRRSVIMAMRHLLRRDGIELTIVGRAPGGARISNDEYWNVIQSARLVISTSSQIAGSHTDIHGLNHFIYRFVEATAAGSALAIEPVPGTEEFFAPDVDYISYSSAEEGARKIRSLWASPGAVEDIARKGHEKARIIVEKQYFWRKIDAELGRDSLRNRVKVEMHQ